MANNETRVIKTDTFEGWRQKSNEVPELCLRRMGNWRWR